MAETALTNAILRWARGAGIFAWKLHGSGYTLAGMPDVCVLVPAQPYAIPVFVEVKQPGKKPTPLQEKRLRDLCNAGAVAFWTDNLQGVVDYVNALQRRHTGWLNDVRDSKPTR